MFRKGTSGAFGRHSQRLAAVLLPLAAATALQFGVTTPVAAADSCPNAQLRTGYSAGLPDCRAYELVTPPGSAAPYTFPISNGHRGTEGGIPGVVSLFDGAPLVQAAGDGNRIAYGTFGLSSQSPGFEDLATRGLDGWSARSVIPPQSVENTANCPVVTQISGWSVDLAKGVLSEGLPFRATDCGQDDPLLVAGEPQGVRNLFVRDTASDSYQLVDVTPAGVTPANATFNAASADLSHVVFDSSAQLTQDAPPVPPGTTTGPDESGFGDNLFEWAAGKVQLVTILPDRTAVQGHLAGATVAGDTPFAHQPGAFSHAVSNDGSRIFFQAGGNLYVRENGTSTVQVDQMQGGSGPGGGGLFAWASTDGSQAFFTDDAAAGLTADTIPSSGQNLYRFDLTTGKLTDLTPVASASVQGVSGASDDGSRLYFVADGALAAGASGGQPNLYLYDDGTTKFIATLAATGSDVCDWTAICLTARVSSDGAYIAFNSTDSLSGYDNTPVDPTACEWTVTPFQPGQACIEIFRYAAAAGALSCASCDPSGAPPTTEAMIPEPSVGFGTIAPRLYLTRNLSNSGQVFFDTADALLPAASNGQSNVYAYDGQLHLISSGTASSDSYFYDASPTGSDVFFLTDQALLPQDTGASPAIYDARIGGGFPYTPPAAPCAGDACRGSLGGPPTAPTAASVSFFGPGNATPPRATPKVTVLSRVVHGSTFFLRVRVPGPGRITVTGNGIRGLSRFVGRAGTYALKVTLTAQAKRTLARKPKLKLTLRVAYQPPGASTSTATVSLTVKPALRHRRRAAVRQVSRRQRGGAR
jgi:WD40-like Beta Propeller Repeat